MRQFIPEQSIQESSQKRSEKHQYYGQKSSTKQDKYGSGTRAHQSPTQSEKDSAYPKTSVTGFFIQDFYGQTLDVFYFFSLYDLDSNDSRCNGNHNNSVHVKRLKHEHFIDAVPRNCLGFCQNNPENKSNK